MLLTIDPCDSYAVMRAKNSLNNELWAVRNSPQINRELLYQAISRDLDILEKEVAHGRTEADD